MNQPNSIPPQQQSGRELLDQRHLEMPPYCAEEKYKISYNLPIPPPPKKYPKSPLIPKTPIQSHPVQPFNPPIQEKIKLSPPKMHHKKYKSIDFSYTCQPLEDIIENKAKIKPKQKAKGHHKNLHEMRVRNTASQMKYFKDKSPEKKEVQRNFNKNKKKTKSKGNDKNKLSKKSVEKHLFSIFQQDRSKKHLSSTFLNSKPSKHLSSIHSNILLKNEYKSMELISRRCKSSLRDKINKKNKIKKLQATLPFPSKVNSLYSNTTSLFCSKSYLQPATQISTVKIQTQESEQMSEIRQFQSIHFMRKDIRQVQSNYSNSAQAIIQKYIEKDSKIEQDSQIPQTQKIIANYLDIFRQELNRMNNPNQNQRSRSFVMELFDNDIQKTDGLAQNQFIAKELQKQNKKQEEESTKLDQLIKLITSTQILGQQNRQKILGKIRQIIPIGLIGSKQLQLPQEEKDASKNRSSKISSSLKDSFPSTQNYQLYNIKTLDTFLLNRQKQLSQQLQQKLREAENKKDGQNIEEKQKSVKWINVLLQQSMKVRMQLWNNFYQAKQLLGQEFQPIKTVHKSNSQEVIIKSKDIAYQNEDKKEPKKENKKAEQNSLSNDSKLHQSPEQKSILIPIKVQQNDPLLITAEEQKQTTPNQPKSLLEQHLFGSHSSRKYQTPSQQNQHSAALHHLIMIDSAQKIQYDYEDDSPMSSDQTPNAPHKRIPCQNSQQNEQNNLSYPSSQFSLSPSPISFKNITESEKQDLFEFIFIDMCVELSQDFNPSHKVVRCVEQFIKQMKERGKKKKGFKVNHETVQDYLEKLVIFVKYKPHIYNNVLAQMQKSMGPTALQLLSYLRPQPASQNSQNEIPSILPVKLFEMHDAHYLDNIQLQDIFPDAERQKKRQIFIRNAMHIHNKAIFDAFNESLDHRRPFGQWGQPFQWQILPSFTHSLTFQHKNQIIKQCTQKVTKDAQYYCGFIPDQQHYSSTIPQFQLQKLRGERLFKLLSQYLSQNQQKLQFIQDDKTELLVLLADSIAQFLISESALFLIL